MSKTRQFAYGRAHRGHLIAAGQLEVEILVTLWLRCRCSCCGFSKTPQRSSNTLLFARSLFCAALHRAPADASGRLCSCCASPGRASCGSRRCSTKSPTSCAPSAARRAAASAVASVWNRFDAGAACSSLWTTRSPATSALRVRCPRALSSCWFKCSCACSNICLVCARVRVCDAAASGLFDSIGAWTVQDAQQYR